MGNDEYFSLYEDMKTFLAFDDTDIANMRSLAGIVERDGAAITDKFYASLEKYPATARIIEGRVDGLKRTHMQWMRDMTTADFGRHFFDAQYRIGEVHVAVGIEPAFVETVMSVLRQEIQGAIHRDLSAEAAESASRSVTKVLDLALMIINMSYQDERLARISGFTGMSRKLIENLVKKGKRAS